MMTPEQIKELATLAANVTHIMESLDELKGTIKALPELLSEFAKSKELESLRDQVLTLKDRIESLERASPTRLWEMTVKGASGVGIVWGVVALVRDFLHSGSNK